MTRFAIINNGVVDNTAYADEPMADNWIPSADAGIGWRIVDGELVPPASTPAIVITSLSVGGLQPLPVSSRVVIRMGQALRVAVEARRDGQLLPLNDSFAVPIRRVGGAVEMTERADFSNGAALISVPFMQQGEFEVTQELVNMHLPPEQRMVFSGLNITVTRT